MSEVWISAIFTLGMAASFLLGISMLLNELEKRVKWAVKEAIRELEQEKRAGVRS